VWPAWSLVGIGGWLGATVAAGIGANDEAPVLRAFAAGGAVFFTVTFAAAAVGMRRRALAFDVGRYRALALRPLSEDEARRVARAGQGPAFRVLAFAALSTALLLGGVVTMSTGLLVAAAVVVALSIVATLLRPDGATFDELLEPLGLHVVTMPTWRGRLVGDAVLRGERHGRAVVVRQTPTSATTDVGGAVITRRGNGAGRFLLEDLHAAEQQASLPSSA
jgi:hypothetical protein